MTSSDGKNLTTHFRGSTKGRGGRSCRRSDRTQERIHGLAASSMVRGDRTSHIDRPIEIVGGLRRVSIGIVNSGWTLSEGEISRDVARSTWSASNGEGSRSRILCTVVISYYVLRRGFFVDLNIQK